MLEGEEMKILHVVPGLDNPFTGIAVAAKLIAGEQAAEMVDAREFGKIKDLAKYEEVWVHSCWLPMTLKACRRVVKAKRSLVRMTHANLDPVRLRYHGWKKWLVGPIERYWLRRADRIVATCDAEKTWIEAYLGKKCPEIEVTDIKRFFKLNGEMGIGKREEGSNSKKLNVLYLGRRHPLKGVKYLEFAVEELNYFCMSRVPGGEDGCIDLRIVSGAKGEELEKVWEWCDVLVLPTLSENFGLVVAEALERGKRVITTDGAPAWGELGNGEWGRYPPSEASPRSGCPSRGGNGEDVGGRLIYLKGFRGGSDAERVRLLKDALMMMV